MLINSLLPIDGVAGKGRVNGVISNPPTPSSWSPPSFGCSKLNVDAAWSDIKGRGGLGWIVRDHKGHAVFGGCKFTSKSSGVSMLEAKVILVGLTLLIEECLGPIPPLEVEFDALEVVGLLNRDWIFFAEIDVIIEDILYFLSSINIKFFCHYSCEDNKAAHMTVTLVSSLR